jgi:hypothetical protein
MYKFVIIVVVCSLFSYSQTIDTVLIKYSWKGIGQYKAELLVPQNYQEKNDYYGEGLITILQYPDSSYIFLHIGGSMSSPLLNQNIDSNIIVMDSVKTEERIIRKGKINEKELFWREDKLLELCVNIGYYSVKSKELIFFEKSIDGFLLIKK